MIAGQSPRLQWKPNPGGAKRSIEEAVEIASRYGVRIPDDVEFVEDEEGVLPKNMTARGPIVSKHAGLPVYWSELVNSLTGRIPFRVRSDVLTSDEAIVGVFGHEMYELEKLRRLLKRGKATIEYYINETRPDNPGNLHQQAWDYADELVERMRQGEGK